LYSTQKDATLPTCVVTLIFFCWQPLYWEWLVALYWLGCCCF